MERRDIVTINLDGLNRDAITDHVVKAMRDVGTTERDIEGFKESTINADYDTTLAKAIGWQAPVCFVKDGQPWVRGDWRRLSRRQRIKRRWSLWGGSYTHPDGTIELESDEKAGIDPRDSQEIQDGKFDKYLRQQSSQETKSFAVLGAVLVTAGIVWVTTKTGMPNSERLTLGAGLLSLGYIVAQLFMRAIPRSENNHDEKEELRRVRTFLATFTEVLEVGGILLMIRLGSRIRQQIERRFSSERETFINDEGDLKREESFVENMPVERLFEHSRNLSAKAETADPKDDFEDVIAFRLLSGWLITKAIARQSRNKAVTTQARELEDLCFFHIENLLRKVRGEPASDTADSNK